MDNRTYTKLTNNNNLQPKCLNIQAQMRKSIISKMSGYSSLLNTASPDEALQILRISLKKQMDRKEKLEKLMQKYEQITTQQKTHIKSIKSSIIELKDLESNSKTKFYLNPIIYVDNRLSKQTREYLCMLLNTFYSKYDQNSQCEFKTKVLSKEMNSLLQSISKNEENLLKIEKQTIGVQVHLEGELLGYKTRFKDQTQRQKQLEEENKRIGTICSQYEQSYKHQLSKVQKLRTTCQQIQHKISQLKQKVAEGELIKKGKEEMMASEIAYQQRFEIQLTSVDEDIVNENERQKLLKNKIKQKRLKVQQLRTKLNKLNVTVRNLDMQNSSFSVLDRSHNNFQHDKSSLNTEDTDFSRSHYSLSKIKKYTEVLDSINNTLEMSKSTLNFGYGGKSKDVVNHQVGMKYIHFKNQNVQVGKKTRIALR